MIEKELRWKDEINLLDVKLKDIELKNNLIEKIVREEVKLNIRDEEIKILGELVKQLQNNWNELKEYLKEKMSVYEQQEASNFYVVLNKMQEIESRK